MRILTRQIHRAFPELDRYSDEQCHRFIRAAKRGVWRLLLHVFLISLVFLAILGAGVVGLVLATGALGHNTPHGAAIPWDVILPVLASIPLMALPPLAAFLTRDWLL